MFAKLPYRVTIERSAAAPRCRAIPLRRTRLRLALAAVLATFGVVGMGLGMVPAAGANSVTLAIPIATLSVTVSPSSMSPTSCSIGAVTTSVLNFPNGVCHYPGITVTNTSTAASAHIDVLGSPAVPSDNGTPWTLTPGSPGTDQFLELTLNTTSSNPLTTSPQCDGAFNPANATDHCAATPNQVATEEILLQGPKVSTDSSTSFTTTVIWTAVQ